MTYRRKKMMCAAFVTFTQKQKKNTYTLLPKGHTYCYIRINGALLLQAGRN